MGLNSSTSFDPHHKLTIIMIHLHLLVFFTCCCSSPSAQVVVVVGGVPRPPSCQMPLSLCALRPKQKIRRLACSCSCDL